MTADTSGGEQTSGEQALLPYVSADRPIREKSEDRLGRTEFAEQLADTIGKWRHRDSLVIGLFGPWGSGKTSVKNLVVERLETIRVVEVLEFNPWQWSGHTSLSAAFFREVGNKLGKHDSSEAAKKAAALIKAYSAFLDLTKEGMLGLPAIAQLGLAIFVLIGFSPQLFAGLADYSELLGLVALGGVAITALLSSTKVILDAWAKWKEARAEADKKTLSELKKEISESLANMDRTLLVIIDDIDRLTKHEIRDVFQLVKANADFPNFVYLLPFQRTAATGLSDLFGESGEAFLEKIIQVPFDIPAPDRESIDRLLTGKLDEIFSPELRSERFDHERWSGMFQSGLDRYFPDLRAVNRFVGSLSFHALLFRRRGVMEVNVVDLIALECIRVFEPLLYTRIRNSKELLTGQLSSDGKDKEENASRVRALLDGLADDRKAAATKILRELFPSREWVSRGYVSGGGNYEQWLRKLQVCTSEMFDRYFQLSLRPGDVSQAELDNVIGATSDERKFDSLLSEFIHSSRLVALLDSLEPALEKIDITHLVTVAASLSALAEQLPEDPPGFFLESHLIKLSRVVRRLLLREASQDKRAEALVASLANASGLEVVVLLVASDLARHANRDPDVLLSLEIAEKLKTRCVERIALAAEQGELIKLREMPYLLFRWKDWADDHDAREWVAQIVEDDASLIRLLIAFTNRQSSTTGRTVTISWFIKLDDLGAFADIPHIEKRLLSVATPGDEAASRALKAFKEAIARREAGTSNE